VLLLFSQNLRSLSFSFSIHFFLKLIAIGYYSHFSSFCSFFSFRLLDFALFPSFLFSEFVLCLFQLLFLSLLLWDPIVIFRIRIVPSLFAFLHFRITSVFLLRTCSLSLSAFLFTFFLSLLLWYRITICRTVLMELRKKHIVFMN